MVANELNDPFAPILLAASTLGVNDAESTLLAQVQEIIEAQADRILRKERDVLKQ